MCGTHFHGIVNFVMHKQVIIGPPVRCEERL